MAFDLNSLDVKERMALARSGLQLEALSQDKCAMVRREVAFHGYGLETLKNDEAAIVREAVARVDSSFGLGCSGDGSAIVKRVYDEKISELKKTGTFNSELHSSISVSHDTADRFSSKEEKYQNKSERFQSKLEKNVMKTEKYDRKVHGKPKTVYTVSLSRDYNPSDERGYSFSAHLDKTVMSRAEYNQNKPRGLLHTLDSRIQTSNIGLVLPVVTRNSEPLINNGAINMNYRKVNVQLRNFTPPKMVMSAASGIKKTALTAESFALKAGDGVKSFGKTTAKTSYSALRMKISNEAFKLSQENTGLKGAMAVHTVVTTTASVLNRTFSAKKEYHIKKKGIRLENKHERLQRKLDKFEMKSIVAKEKADFKRLKTDLSAIGVDMDVRFDREAKKKSWQKVFDGAEGRNYLKKPEVKSMKLSSKTDTLALKEYKQAKKIYKTKRVKEVSFNELTGKKQVTSKRVVDYSRKKTPRVKKPHGLIFNSVGAGLGVVGNKAVMALSNADDVGAQAVGKGLQALNELSRFAKQQNALRSKLKFDKKAKAAELRLNKLHNKLQFEKEKVPVANSKKNLKKAQKRQLRKRRNQESFKQRMKNTAKKLKNAAQDGIKNLLKKKNSFIILGLGAGLLVFILPLLPLLLVGGGGGSGAPVMVASYLTDRQHLVDYNNQFNDLVWKWQSSINSKMDEYSKDDTNEWELVLNPCSGGPLSNCPNMKSIEYEEDSSNVYKVRKNLYGGERCDLTNYDITCLYAYFTIKYKDADWGSISSEFNSFFDTYYELKSKPEDVVKYEQLTKTLDTHTHVSCSVDSETHNHNHTSSYEEHDVDTSEYIRYYFLYPKDENNPMTIQRYIEEEIEKMGDADGDGVNEGELQYDMLKKSLGLHQTVGYPVKDAETGKIVDWSLLGRQFGSYGELYDQNLGASPPVLPDYRYKKTDADNSINICGSSKLEAVAGGKGVIKSKSNNTIEVEYPDDNLIITYTCTMVDGKGNKYDGEASGITSLPIDSPVEDGTHLFYSVSTTEGYSPSISISAYCTDIKSYINPLLVVKSHEL